MNDALNGDLAHDGQPSDGSDEEPLPRVDQDEQQESNFDDSSCSLAAAHDTSFAGPAVGGSTLFEQPRGEDSAALSWVVGTRQQEGRRRIFIQSGVSHDQQLCDRILQRLGWRELFLVHTDWLFQIKVKDSLLGTLSFSKG